MPTVHDVFSVALHHYRNGDWGRALALSGVVLAVEPTHADAPHVIGLILRQNGDRPRAAAWMVRALRINDTLASRHRDLGDVLFELERFEDAGTAFRASLERAPEHAQTLLALAQALRYQGRLEQAVGVFRRAAALSPNLADAYYGIGAAVEAQSAALGPLVYEETARHFRRTVCLAPGHAVAWINLCIILGLAGRSEESVAAGRCALMVRPASARAMARLAQFLLIAGRPRAALDLLRRAARLIPDDWEIETLRERAETYRRLGGWAADPALPAGLAVRGTFRNTSGYAFMVRQFVRRLHARHVPVQLMDVPVQIQLSDRIVPLHESMSAAQRDPFFDRVSQPVRARALLNFMTPDLAEPLPGMGGVMFSMSETRRVPAHWLGPSLRQDHLIVPTPSSAEAWMAVGYPAERIHLCPLGVKPQTAAEVEPIGIGGHGRSFADFRTRIVNISDLTQRKNLDGLLRVWLRATRATDDAALLLKMGKGIPGEEAQIGAFLASVATALGRSYTEAAPIFLMAGSFSDQEMKRILAASTHYWSMSHGEGWDLPMTQAGALGLTLIAPRHSAYTAYLDEEVALMLPADVSPARPPYSGLEWWTPDEAVATDILSRVIQNGLAPPRSARDRLASGFTWEQAGDRLIAVLREIGALG